VDLNLVWFVLLGVLLTGYAVLDGFDLGVGILHPFIGRTDHDRRILMNSIGPLWDGNEVWLVVFGGALFAAFPEAYATAFSSFYLPFMVLLAAIIGRAVSIEFRGKAPGRLWRSYWDWSFCLSSAVATFLFGVSVGGSILGLPVGPDREFDGELADLVQPYALVVGAFAVATFAMHGSIYLYLKTEGDLQRRVRAWMWGTFFAFLAMYAVTTAMTLLDVPAATRNFREHPWAWGVVVLNVLAVANIPRAIYLGRPFYAFLSSCATIAAFTFVFGVALFPNLIASTFGPQNDLTIYNAASSQKTLGIMLTVAALGLPFVLSYTAVVYWVFRGKVKLGESSY